MKLLEDFIKQYHSVHKAYGVVHIDLDNLPELEELRQFRFVVLSFNASCKFQDGN